MKKLLGSLVLVMAFTFSVRAHASVVPLLIIQDSVNASMKLRIDRALETAKTTGAPALFIELDTPGGYLDVTRQIVKDFLASELPVIVYVAPQGAHAASAGAMITMAAHFAAMAPSTSIGAATPVNSGGEDIQGDMKRKVTNDTVAFIEGIAEKRGRNKAFAKEAVTLAVALNSSDAFKKGAIDGVFDSREAVWKAARKKFPTLPETVSFEVMDPSLKERAVSLLSNPNVAYGLMALGMIGVYMEVHAPGAIVPGLLGVASLALGSLSMQIIPIKGSAIILLVLGIVCLGVEVLTPLPTFGMAGLGALVLFFLSGVFLMDESQGNMGLSPGIWLPVFAVVTLAIGLLSYFTFKSIRSKPKLVQGARGMVGLDARITRKHHEHLSLSVIGEIWTGFPLGADINDFSVGELVEIVSQEGLKVFFKKKEKKEY
ncbi:MAG: hypothetical protein ABIR96_03655 [Bdellovibrionota bacterium]